MAPNIVQDSDDELDHISPTKAFRTREDLSLQGHESTNKSLKANASSMVSGVKRKPTTMEMLESWKRARPDAKLDSTKFDSTKLDSPPHQAAEKSIDAVPANGLDGGMEGDQAHPVEKDLTQHTSALPSQRHDSRSIKADTPTLPEIPIEAQRASSKRSRYDIPSSSDPGPDLPPKENYKPRPSRSRASGAVEGIFDAIDFSKRPEDLLKAGRRGRAKKSRTIASEDSEQLDHSSDSVAVVKTDARTDRSEQPDVAEAKERSSARAIDGPKKKRGRPKKDASKETQPLVADDESEAGALEDVRAANAEDEVSCITKQRRQRATASLSGFTEEPVRLPLSPSKAANSERPRDPTSPIKASTSADVENSRASPLNETTLPTTPQKATSKTTASTSKGPSKHSPLSGGKVTCRVGLSRKARIEPLLRVVKK